MCLQLPKTKLALHDGMLTKTGEDDALIAELPLSEISDVRIEKTTEYPFPLVIVGIFLALAVVSKVYMPSTGWGWAGTIVCLGIAGFAVMMISGRKIVIETQNGTVGYPVADGFEEADGFVVSLRRKVSWAQGEGAATGKERP